ncbi:GPALPP motifs-containing protein 1 [Papilio machaon]|uniref:GPALPP motifs-containing protein 1 n=1 Tax=Papilio machaon TaxID=76193 RepID=UPI001E662EF4|nr:GPALPP motifs-containing protein 1 [Papilio machaon]
MLSDESSSDSETGRFKCKTKTQDEAGQHSKSRDSSFHTRDSRASGRNRRNEIERYHREFERRRDDRRDVFESRERDRHRYSRHSPVRRRRSVERSRHREDSQERRRHDRDSRERFKHNRSRSRDRMRRSESKTHRSPNHVKSKKEIIDSDIIEKKPDKLETNEFDDISSSSEIKSKRSEVFKPDLQDPAREKIKSPVIVDIHGDSDSSVGEKPASYYNMIPAIVKEKSEESSEIDSSDDEKLRAKLLSLEKQVNKTKKRKHRKKHKKKGSRSDKEKSQESTASVEVSSTTDIQDNTTSNKISSSETAEVTSTQKSVQKESSEEGEILSDDESQSPKIDPTDLRHKLKRSTLQSGVCGPALPPHLEKRCEKSASPGTEGPALPPHLSKKPRHLGPSIPQDMRKVLEEKSQEITHFESSDEDVSIVGPLPVGAEDKWTNAHKSLEERALDMKIKKLDGHTLNKVDVKSREQWMLELPEGKTKYLGLEARSFRAKEGPDMSDRSSWTDTPEDKARKASGRIKEEDAAAVLQQEVRQKQIASRDDEQEKAIKKHKKKHKRDESLLEMHQKKIKKKKKKDDKEDEKPERRPFSRDVDLQVNRFDEAQKRSIIKKAQELDSRFSRGEAKYL